MPLYKKARTRGASDIFLPEARALAKSVKSLVIQLDDTQKDEFVEPIYEKSYMFLIVTGPVSWKSETKWVYDSFLLGGYSIKGVFWLMKQFTSVPWARKQVKKHMSCIVGPIIPTLKWKLLVTTDQNWAAA